MGITTAIELFRIIITAIVAFVIIRVSIIVSLRLLSSSLLSSPSSLPLSSPGILVRIAILTIPIIFEFYIATDLSLCCILIIIISIYLSMPPSTPKPLMPLWALAYSILTISPNRLQEYTTSLACLIQGQ
jgi:hypothetical protein